MRVCKLKVVALAMGIAFVGPANAATIDYIFTGTANGTLGTSAFNGNFNFTIVGDTGAVTTGSDNNNPFANAGAASFTSGSLTAGLTNTKVSMFNDNATSVTFPSIGFFQSQPSPVFVVGEALATGTGVLGSYDLTTAFGLISSGSSGNTVSFIPQLFLTDSGNLTFSGISSLSFQAELPASATPLPAALPLFAGGLGLMGFLARRRKKKAINALAA